MGRDREGRDRPAHFLVASAAYGDRLTTRRGHIVLPRPRLVLSDCGHVDC